MPVLTSKLNPRSEAFRASADQMRALVDDLNAKLARIAETIRELKTGIVYCASRNGAESLDGRRRRAQDRQPGGDPSGRPGQAEAVADRRPGRRRWRGGEA